MSFWQKNEDPWDIDPGKRRAKREREPAVTPLDTLKAWNQRRKDDAAAREAERAALPAEKCPWCGQDMERGYLSSGRDIIWTPGFCKWLGTSKEARKRQLQVNSEGSFASWQTAWICQACQKMTLDTSRMKNLYDGYSFWDASPDLPAEEGEEDGGEEAP